MTEKDVVYSAFSTIPGKIIYFVILTAVIPIAIIKEIIKRIFWFGYGLFEITAHWITFPFSKRISLRIMRNALKMKYEMSKKSQERRLKSIKTCDEILEEFDNE